MSLRQYLLIMSVGTIMCWVAWFLILKQTNPAETSWVGFAFFYSTFFLSIVGTLAVLGFVIRVWILKYNQVISREVLKAFRQAVFFGLLIVGVLALKSLGYLTFLTSLLYIAFFAILEVVFISSKRPR